MMIAAMVRIPALAATTALATALAVTLGALPARAQGAASPPSHPPRAAAVALDGNAGPNGLVGGENGEEQVWFTAAARSAIGEIDVVSREVGYISLGHGAKPRGLARCANGKLYALDPVLNVIHEVTPATEEVKRHTMPGGQNVDLSGAACTAGNQLIFTGYNGFVGRLDTLTGAITLAEAQGGRGASPITIAPSGAVWFASYVGNQVVRVDPASLRQEAFQMPAGVSGPKGIAADASGRIWVTAFRSARIARFDPRRRDWSAWAVGEGAKPYALTRDETGAMLVTDTGRNVLLKVDAASGSVSTLSALSERGQARGMARIGAKVWIAESAADSVAVVDLGAPASN